MATCSHCKNTEGSSHPITDQEIKKIIVNHEGDAWICSECVVLCVSIIGSDLEAPMMAKA